MTSLATLIGGAVIAVLGIVIWMRTPRRKRAPVDPIASTTGSNRTLTGTQPSGSAGSLQWDEALRRFVAYALDDAPRDSLSQPPDPANAPVFKAVQQVLERIEARPEYFPRRPSLLPKLMATVNDTIAHQTVVRGPVSVRLGVEPRLVPCPICRRPVLTGATARARSPTT